MKDKILKEAIQWYENKSDRDSNVFIEDFVNMVINRTTDSLFEKVKYELKDEFEKGNLTHPFIISSDYYLDLKLKDIKQKVIDSKLEEE